MAGVSDCVEEDPVTVATPEPRTENMWETNDFSTFTACILFLSKVLLGFFTEFRGCHTLSKGFDWVLTELSPILSDFGASFMFLLAFSRFYWVLPGFKKFQGSNNLPEGFYYVLTD